ncbi:hypothetical protein CBR_g26451 [Chara braunii]|uniref:RING-type domain-containing protein n=1 Tax=Chara braunii TaxID=69332 RepID=A0A388L861_CHABU|nr:hypothetical protein CBR_g26451 [Chara braunii]|eukprot:GBG78422.1 hypothetical protein CBR_g26451 [Chara braunii]
MMDGEDYDAGVEWNAPGEVGLSPGQQYYSNACGEEGQDPYEAPCSPSAGNSRQASSGFRFKLSFNRGSSRKHSQPKGQSSQQSGATAGAAAYSQGPLPSALSYYSGGGPSAYPQGSVSPAAAAPPPHSQRTRQGAVSYPSGSSPSPYSQGLGGSPPSYPVGACPCPSPYSQHPIIGPAPSYNAGADPRLSTYSQGSGPAPMSAPAGAGPGPSPHPHGSSATPSSYSQAAGAGPGPSSYTHGSGAAPSSYPAGLGPGSSSYTHDSGTAPGVGPGQQTCTQGSVSSPGSQSYAAGSGSGPSLYTSGGSGPLTSSAAPGLPGVCLPPSPYSPSTAPLPGPPGMGEASDCLASGLSSTPSSGMGSPSGLPGANPPQHPAPSFVRYHNSYSEPWVGIAALDARGSIVPRHPFRGELSMVQIPMQYFCMVCLDVVKNPVTLTCGHEMCNDCFAKRVPRGSPTVCPVVDCGRPSNDAPVPNVSNQATVGSIRIRCTNGISYDVQSMRYKRLKQNIEGVHPPPADNYCREQLTFDTLESHLQKCPYSLKLCRYQPQGCDEVCLARELAQHEGMCTFRMAACPECNQEVPHTRLQDHMVKECRMATVHCTYEDFGCSFTGLRSTLEAHVDKCPFGEPSVRASFEALTAQLSRMRIQVQEECNLVKDLQRQLQFFRHQQGSYQ